MPDLVVLGQDPRYGGGAAAQMNAFIDGARGLGRDPQFVYVSHPTFDGRRATFDRIEPVRVWRKRLPLRAPLWTVATTAHHAAPALRAGVPYDAWIGASLRDEWRGRRHGLGRARRIAQTLNAAPLLILERRVLRNARRLFATSGWSRQTMAEAGALDEATIGVLPLPVDVGTFSPEPDESWLARLDTPVLAFVGRANDPRKNVRLLLDAARSLPDVRVRLIGERPEDGQLPPNVEATGPVRSVAEHLRTAALCVLPAWQEGFGIVAAEALACGVPVVTTPSGGPEELVERSGGGRILTGWSADELASVCHELLADVATLAALRRSGREYVVAEHSTERFGERLAAIID
jgi:glycosyltransferase involved in cell wall biosynthesis